MTRTTVISHLSCFRIQDLPSSNVTKFTIANSKHIKLSTSSWSPKFHLKRVKAWTEEFSEVDVKRMLWTARLRPKNGSQTLGRQKKNDLHSTANQIAIVYGSTVSMCALGNTITAQQVSVANQTLYTFMPQAPWTRADMQTVFTAKINDQHTWIAAWALQQVKKLNR